MKISTLIFITLTLLLFLGCDNNTDDSNPIPNEIVGWISGDVLDGYGTILHTNNGGNTWARQGNANQIPNVEISDICAVNNSTAWACGDSIDGYGTLLRTTDAGLTWIRTGSATEIPNVNFNSISAVNINIAYAVGFSGMVLKTIDGGNTWIQQAQGLIPEAELERVYAYDESIVWAVGGTGNGDTYIIHTTNGGNKWTSQGENDIPVDMVGLIDVHALNPQFAWAVGTGAGTLRTTDGGQNWESIVTPIGIGHNNGLCIINDTTTWVAADYCTIFNYETDTSNHWNKHAMSCNPDALWPVLLGITVKDTKIWVVGSSGGIGVTGDIFYSSDGGKTWNEQANPLKVNLKRVSFANALR